jgi:AraC-like DNA-binding protein/quercetin dioxygenase-like cupin family protein
MVDATPICVTPDGSQLRLVSYSPGLRQRRHAHEHASITLVLAGGLEEASARATSHAGAGWMCVKAAGVEHECRFGAGGTRTLQLQLVHSNRVAEEVLPDWQWRPPGGLALDMLALVRVANAKPKSSRAEEAGELLQDLLAEFQSVPERTSAHAPSWLPRIRRALEESDETIADLARECDVHRVYFARSFRRHVGMSPAHYRRVMRVLRTVNALQSDTMALAEVALAEGFADQSHMIRELRAETGLTPLAWRRIAG